MAIINKLEAIFKYNFEQKTMLQQARQTRKNSFNEIVFNWLSVYTFVSN